MLARSYVNRRTIRHLAVAVLSVATLWFVVHYQRYIVALGWHCVHGNHASVGENVVSLPLWWSAYKDPEHYDTYVIVRATDSTPEPKIEIRPALTGSVRDTNDEEFKAVQYLVEQSHSTSSTDIQSSLVVIHSHKFAWYCDRTEYLPFGVALNSSLSCNAARNTHVWSYFGPVLHENEAKAILATLD